MKKQDLGLMITALLGAGFIQLCFCSSALAQQWVANGQFSFKQASDRSGGVFRLQQTGNDLRGTADHWLVIDEKGKVFGVVTVNETTRPISTTGTVLSGQIIGDKFNLAVKYQPMRYDGRTYMNELTYVYQGTIDSAGYVRGTLHDPLNPGKTFGFSIETPLSKYVPPPAPPAPKVLKSTGRARTSSSASSGPTASANPAPWVNLIGKWETQAGGKTLIMDFTQNGDLVQGRYEVVGAAPVNGSLLGRIAPDGRLTFSWKQSDGTGVGTFMPDQSCTQLNGGYTAQTPVVSNGTWVGRRTSVDPPRPPAAQVFPVFPPNMPAFQPQILRNEQLKQLNRVYQGKWVVKTKSGAEFKMDFAQNGKSVTGSYQPKNGKIDGTMADDGLLTYRWSDESGASGAGIFAIYDGAQLIGTYSASQNPWEVSGQWTGGRSQ